MCWVVALSSVRKMRPHKTPCIFVQRQLFLCLYLRRTRRRRKDVYLFTGMACANGSFVNNSTQNWRLREKRVASDFMTLLPDQANVGRSWISFHGKIGCKGTGDFTRLVSLHLLYNVSNTVRMLPSTFGKLYGRMVPIDSSFRKVKIEAHGAHKNEVPVLYTCLTHAHMAVRNPWVKSPPAIDARAYVELQPKPRKSGIPKL